MGEREDGQGYVGLVGRYVSCKRACLDVGRMTDRVGYVVGWL